MKPLSALLLWSALCAAGPAAAQPASDGLFGLWAVDLSRLPMPAQARPRSVTIRFTAEGPDRLRTRVEVVDPGGALQVAEGVTPLDGTPTEVAGNFEADLSATTMPRPEVLVMQLAQRGTPASTRVYAVAPDGRTMLETVAFFDEQGRPVLRRHHFTRQP